MKLGSALTLAALLAASASVSALGNSSGGVVILGGISDDAAGIQRPVSSYRAPAIKPQEVQFPTELPPGSLVIRTAERRLYLVLPGGKALMYAVGVGREGFTWSGRNRITRKAEWPDWRPPASMIEREARRNHFIPKIMKGGPGNPLGARALYIGDTEYRIHGTTQPWSIGRAVSSGCIRMLNEEVIDLYARVDIGATVVVE